METLPVDVITDILLRLPAKIVLRFKCVCKLWYDLISGPNFINLHLERSLAANTNLHFVVATPMLHLVNFDTFSNPVELDYLSKHLDNGIVHVVGSCHGLLCLFYYKYSYTFILYNPTTRTHKLLPFLPVTSAFHYPKGRFCFGFGYDRFSGEYKCVRILQAYVESGSFECEVMVYSMKTDSWRRVQDVPYYFNYHNGDSAVVDGAIYWAGQDRNQVFLPIVSFDLKDETFSSIALPNLDEYCEPVHMSVGVLDGCLCLMVNDLYISEVWIMKEYGVPESWTRLFCVGKRKEYEYLQRPLCFSISRKELLMRICLCQTAKIDMETMEVTDVKVGDFHRCLDAWVCVENLLVLKDEYDDHAGGQVKGRKKSKRKSRRKKRRRTRRL